MSESRATLAIVRRHIDRRFAIDFAIAGAIVGALAYVFAPSYGRAAGPVALASLAAALVVETENVRSFRRLTFFTVPLFGRQLARAHAIAPTLAALALPLGYAVGAAFRGAPLAPERAVVITVCTVVATLVALSAAFRDGRDRAIYIALAVAAGAAIDLASRFAGRHALAIAIGIAFVIGFLAMRAFGETLARYDPLPDEEA